MLTEWFRSNKIKFVKYIEKFACKWIQDLTDAVNHGVIDSSYNKPWDS